MERFRKFSFEFKNKDISRPPYWVGIKIKPDEFEFWEGDNFRLHKRN